MERIEMTARVRKDLGKGPVRRMRQEGLIPGVVYGPHIDALPISVELKQLARVLAAGENVLVNLKIQSGRKRMNRLVMIKDYDLHPISDYLRHVDLYEVSLEEAIRVEVPISFVGEPEGVKMGGVLSPLIRTLEISCLPEQIPEHIEVDCSMLNIGDTVHLSEISLPAEVEVITDAYTAVVTVSPPEEIEVAEAEAEEEEEVAAAEGEPEGGAEEAGKE